MGGHDHHHHEPYKVPDYKIYRVEDVPLLMKTKQALEAQGLSDPWLRNEVWRYNPKEFSNSRTRTRIVFFRGFKYGAIAAAITVAGTFAYDKMFPSSHHGHGHDH